MLFQVDFVFYILFFSIYYGFYVIVFEVLDIYGFWFLFDYEYNTYDYFMNNKFYF